MLTAKREINLFKPIFWGGIVGAVIYLALYGLALLDVTYVDWIYSKYVGGDMCAYQFGWEFYRNDDWQFPIGYMSKLRYGVGQGGMGLLYMDLVPLFAVFFKLIRAVLPVHFQYLGLWHLFCFILQGAFASAILKKYLSSIWTCLGLTPLFVMTSFMLWRTFRHSALGGQWVLLFALMIWVYKDEYFFNAKRQLIAWVAATALTIWVQIYFLLPVGITMVCFLLEDWIEHKRTMKVLLIFFSCVAGVFLSFWQLGGFVLSIGKVSGFGHYSMNLLSLFDSDGFSSVLPDIPSSDGNYEGWNYLGLAGIILLVISLVSTLYRLALDDGWPREIEGERLARLLAVGMFFLATTVVALSPVVYCGPKIILDYSWFSLYTKIMSPFRCSGRTFWIATYVILLFSTVTVFKRIRKPAAAVILALALVAVQIYDFHPLIQEMHWRTHHQIEYTSPLSSDIWDDIAEKVEHVFRLSYDHWGYAEEFPLDFYATENDLTINNAYIGKNNDEENLENIAQGIHAVMTNDLEPDTLYCVLDNRAFTEANMTGEDVVELHVDGYHVYIHKSIWDQLDQEKYQDIYRESTGEYLTAREAYMAENADV